MKIAANSLFNSFLIIFLISIFPGCKTETQEPLNKTTENGLENLEQLSWILGKWERERKNGSAYEVWERVDNQSFKGLAFVVNGNDTTIIEILELKHAGNEIFYIPTVPHNPGPVPFKLVKITKTIAVFENREHDFPNRIIYTHQPDGSLLARIEDTAGEKGRNFHFQQSK